MHGIETEPMWAPPPSSLYLLKSTFLFLLLSLSLPDGYALRVPYSQAHGYGTQQAQQSFFPAL